MKKTKKKILSLLLTAALVLSLLPSVTLTAWAATTTYIINDGSVSIKEAGDYVITGTGSATTNTITVASDISGEVNITLSEVSIDVSGTTNACAFSIGTGSTVNLTLIGDSILKSNGNSAGLQVPLGAGLTITAASTGSIAAAGGSDGAGFGAGIGAGFNNNAGYITINGGTVNATANYGAAIGGGYGATGGNGGIITINGGVITATIISTGIGAAIGGGGGGDGRVGGDGGIISITGGTVNATGVLGAAIGGGGCGTTRGGSGGNISISGGNVTAKNQFADIGGGSCVGGWGGSGGTIIITGGTVTTDNPSAGSSDIGGGCDSFGDGVSCLGDGGILLINGGSVNSYVDGRSIFQSQANPIKEYKATIKGLPHNSGVTCSINGGDAFSCDTDSSGYVYLWLPVGDNEVLVNSGSASYKASGTITAVNTNELTASAYTADLSVITASLPYGVIGTAYSQTLTAVGGTSPYTWSVDSLPSGLSLDPATGIISGTPTKAGTYTVKATVTDSISTPVSVSKDLTLTVYATSSSSVPRITVANGIAFSVTIYDSNEKYAGDVTTDYGTITGTVSGSDTILTGTLTGVPTTWTEVTLTGGKVMIRSVSPSTTVTNPSFN